MSINESNSLHHANNLKDQSTSINTIKTIKEKIKAYFNNKYNNEKNLEYQYIGLITRNLIFNRNTHLVSMFKDNMIMDYIEEFLKRFYDINDSYNKIPKIAVYYHNYLMFFCTPTLKQLTINSLIHNRYEKKAEFFYNENNKCSACKKEMKSLDDSSNNDEKNDCFFNEKIRKKIERYSPIHSSMALPQSGSTFKKDTSGLLITESNEISLVNIMMGLINKNVSNTSEIKSKEKQTQKIEKEKEKNKNKKIINGNISFVSSDKDRENNNNKNYVCEPDTKMEKIDKNSMSNNTLKKIEVQDLKVLLKNNIEKFKSKSNKKIIKKKGLWNLLNDKDIIIIEEKISNDNNNKKYNMNIINNKDIIKQEKVLINTLYKKKEISKIKSKDNKKQNNSKNQNQNTINNLTNNSNYGSFENITNKKKTNNNITRLSKKNNKINNNRNNLDSLLNKIKNNTYNTIKRKKYSSKKIILKNQKKNNLTRNNNFNVNKIDTFGLTSKYLCFNNSIKNNNYHHIIYKNNSNNEIRANSNKIKYNKKLNSPPSFLNYRRLSKLEQKKIIMRNEHKSLDDKSNHIHNVNININNQINIGFNQFKDLSSLIGNNTRKNRKKTNDKNVSRNKNKSIDLNTINQNIIINNNYQTFFSNNNRIKNNMGAIKNIKLYGFKNKNIISRNNHFNYNIDSLLTKNKDKSNKYTYNYQFLFNSFKSLNNNNNKI